MGRKGTRQRGQCRDASYTQHPIFIYSSTIPSNISNLAAPMPDTGDFYLHAVSGVKEKDSGRFTEIMWIRATCSKCRYIVQARQLPELESVAGGTILCCPQCGARQAISNARFDIFTNRATASAERAPSER